MIQAPRQTPVPCFPIRWVFRLDPACNRAHFRARRLGQTLTRLTTQSKHSLSAQWRMYRIAQSPPGATWSNGGLMIGFEVSGGGRHVLHIGGTTTAAGMIRAALTESNGERYEIEWVGPLSEGLERLTTDKIKAE